MPKREHISMSVIRRLPRYYRFLSELAESGIVRISSGELARRMGLTASQIRQDLNCFGGFGQQGFGYAVDTLKSEIEGILGLKNRFGTILIGMGNLGRAVVTHMSFESRGYELLAVFDNDETVIGKTVRGFKVQNIKNLEAFCTAHKPTVAVLCIPKESAEQLCKHLIDYGVKGFWNFSHYDIAMNYPDAVVENVHLGDSLMTLSYKVQQYLNQS